MATVSRLLALPLVVVVRVYQLTLSPDHGLLKVYYPQGFCKYHPSCSEYSKQVLLKQGILGIPRIIKRLISCNPWSKGGIDLP